MKNNTLKNKKITAPELLYELDILPICALAVAVLFIGIAIYFGGTAYAFVDLPAMSIVFGCTFAVMVASFSYIDIRESFFIVGKALFYRPSSPSLLASELVKISSLTFKSGTLILQDLIPQIKHDKYFQALLMLIIDANSPKEIEATMRNEMETTQIRYFRSVDLLKRGAEISPAMGLIGTLVGLVQLLRNLDDPSSIGPNMAIALLTTFYGALLAHIVFYPLAIKLEKDWEKIYLMMQLKLTTGLAMVAHQNPRKLEVVLNAMLSTGEQVHVINKGYWS